MISTRMRECSDQPPYLLLSRMVKKLEHLYGMRFWQRLGDTHAETIRKIKHVFRDSMSIKLIKEWYNPYFLNALITGDELWVFGYDPETKVPSSQWKHLSLTPK
ncbi:hypothetical protein BsWGS_16867 [Bradybaena similaris]